MNRSSAFLEGSFVTDDQYQLEDVLQHFLKLDIDMMELLNFTMPERVIRETDGKELNVRRSALSRALKVGNYKNVSLILKMMSRYSRHDVCQFSHLFQDLLDYESFQTYLTKLMNQTKFMASKQIFKVSQPFSSKIVAICESMSTYTDDGVYFDQMGEAHKHERGV